MVLQTGLQTTALFKTMFDNCEEMMNESSIEF